MNYQYEEIDEHIQWLINFMKEEYPNNYELIIDNNSGTIRSTLQAQTFLRNDLRLGHFVETMMEVTKENQKNKLCECWESCDHYALCNGTKEKELCHCGGDERKCDFYPKKRERAGEVNKA